MLVTEGEASGRSRRVCWAVTWLLCAAVAAAVAWRPVAGEPLLWVSMALWCLIAGRHLFFSLTARFLKAPSRSEPERQPSFVFIIPCLNELPSLRKTVPALRKLRCDGGFSFLHVCEAASTDGTEDYLKEAAAEDERMLPIVKDTPPAGRGAAIAYGLERAPEGEVVGFLDADHVLGQESLDALVRIFGREDPPPGVQGVCAASNRSATPLARLLAIERDWMERVELQVAPRMWGISQFGGGQGFFQREVLEDPRFRIDESMILDDTDLSCRLALQGYRVAFAPDVVTASRRPEGVREFLDQRFRWARGWLQMGSKYLKQVFAAGGARVGVRLDLLRLVLTPFLGVLLCLGFAAAVGALISFSSPAFRLGLAVLLLPFLLGFQPYLAGARAARIRDFPLVFVGVPLLFTVYTILLASALVEWWVLRRPPRYSKTGKPD